MSLVVTTSAVKRTNARLDNEKMTSLHKYLSQHEINFLQSYIPESRVGHTSFIRPKRNK